MEDNNNTNLTPQGEKESRGSQSGQYLKMVLCFCAGAILACVITANVLTGILQQRLAALGSNTAPNTTTSGTTSSEVISSTALAKLEWMRSVLDQNFLYGTENTDFESGLLKGYVDSLGDPYTVYYTAEEYARMQETTTGSYTGIGVVVTQDATTGMITVVRPYANSPGAEAGILPNDIIYKVEGEEVTGVDVDLIVTKIKGQSGTSVNITIYRPSTGEYIDMDITRRQLEIETISHEMLDGQIGYISMSSFDEVTYNQFMTAYNDLHSQGMKGVIVDIRNNGGGLLTSVTDILDQLLPEGIITYTEDKNGNGDTYRSDANTVLDVPMAVLVNGNSASASEVFTGALKDYGLATIVGTQTFGKGIVQVLMPMNDGTAIKFTISRYFTPSGVCIQGEGITPDVVVELDEAATGMLEIPHDVDNQLQAAIKAVQSQTSAEK